MDATKKETQRERVTTERIAKLTEKHTGSTFSNVLSEDRTRSKQVNALNVIPESERAGFIEWAKEHPRLKVSLDKETATESEINAALAEYRAKDEKALAISDARELARELGVKDRLITALGHLYSEQEIKDLAIVAITTESDLAVVAGIDTALMEDGSFSGRLIETRDVAIAHTRLQEAMKKAIEQTIKDYGTEKVREGADEVYDKLRYEKIAKLELKYPQLKRDSEEYEQRISEVAANQATEEYVKIMREKYSSAKTTVKLRIPDLDSDDVVELFKLFNYDREVLNDFVDFAEEQPLAEEAVTPSKINMLRLLKQVVGDFLKENIVTLNCRSEFYPEFKKYDGGLPMELTLPEKVQKN